MFATFGSGGNGGCMGDVLMRDLPYCGPARWFLSTGLGFGLRVR